MKVYEVKNQYGRTRYVRLSDDEAKRLGEKKVARVPDPAKGGKSIGDVKEAAKVPVLQPSAPEPTK